MFKHVKMLLVALVALAAFASTASAYTVSPGGAITATSNGKLTLRSTLATTQCDVRLIGSIATSGVAGSTIGAITSTSITSCLGGIGVTDLISTRGTWPLRLNSVSGTPVNAALVTISNVAFALSSPPCLYTGSVGFNLTEPNSIALQANSLASTSCGTASLSGSFTLSPNQDIS